MTMSIDVQPQTEININDVTKSLDEIRLSMSSAREAIKALQTKYVPLACLFFLMSNSPSTESIMAH